MCAPPERHSQLSEIQNKGPGSLRILYEDLQPNPELIKVSLKLELRRHLHVSPPLPSFEPDCMLLIAAHSYVIEILKSEIDRFLEMLGILIYLSVL